MHTIEQRIARLENVMNTVPSAIMNIILELLTEISKLEAADKTDLKERLERLRDVVIDGGNQQAYNDLINLAVRRLD